MSDYKMDIYELAENLAMEMYEEGYYDLSDDEQDYVWKQAEEKYWEARYSL